MGLIKTAMMSGVGIYGISQLSKVATSHNNNYNNQQQQQQQQRDGNQYDNYYPPQRDPQRQYGYDQRPARGGYGPSQSRDVYYQEQPYHNDYYQGQPVRDNYYQASYYRKQEEGAPPDYQERGMKMIQDRMQRPSSSALDQGFEVLSEFTGKDCKS